MFKLARNSLSAKMLQVLLAVGYVALVRQLLAFQALFFGECGSGFWHVSVMLVVVALSMFVLFLINFALLRHSFMRLGLFASLAIFIYFYVYSPDGNYIMLIVSLLHSPPHLINMFLLVASPVITGRLLQFWFSHSKLCLTYHSSGTPNGAP